MEPSTTENQNAPRNKLCSNCAYRATCNKRFNAQVSNGQVHCMDHSYDVSLFKAKPEPRES